MVGAQNSHFSSSKQSKKKDRSNTKDGSDCDNPISHWFKRVSRSSCRETSSGSDSKHDDGFWPGA